MQTDAKYRSIHHAVFSVRKKWSDKHLAWRSHNWIALDPESVHFGEYQSYIWYIFCAVCFCARFLLYSRKVCTDFIHMGSPISVTHCGFPFGKGCVLFFVYAKIWDFLVRWRLCCRFFVSLPQWAMEVALYLLPAASTRGVSCMLLLFIFSSFSLALSNSRGFLLRPRLSRGGWFQPHLSWIQDAPSVSSQNSHLLRAWQCHGYCCGEASLGHWWSW